jgi:molybdopterin converting factor small subunit
MKTPFIQLKLFAALTPLSPANSDQVPIAPGTSVKDLLNHLEIPIAKAHLIFIDGVKRSLEDRLHGGERVGIFPPVAGG